ncbi:MAG TPA: hypothetical protein VNQ53_05250 [Nocardioides sp.]|nr:hypothetical protein [Nocardioides sp.]
MSGIRIPLGVLIGALVLRPVLVAAPSQASGFRGGDTLRGLDRANGGPGWDICLAERAVACP